MKRICLESKKMFFCSWTYRTDCTKMFTLTYFVQTSFTHLDISFPNLLIFFPIKDFLDGYNVEHPIAKRRILKNFGNTESFLQF